jgi:hypothetical protein
MPPPVKLPVFYRTRRGGLTDDAGEKHPAAGLLPANDVVRDTFALSTAPHVINCVADAHVPRHCERSEAIQFCAVNSGLLPRLAPRNDEGVKSVRTFNECVSSARPSYRVFSCTELVLP